MIAVVNNLIAEVMLKVKIKTSTKEVFVRYTNCQLDLDEFFWRLLSVVLVHLCRSYCIYVKLIICILFITSFAILQESTFIISSDNSCFYVVNVWYVLGCCV